MTATTVTPIDLFASFLRLHRDGHVSVTPQEFDPAWDAWQVMAFHAETDADVHADHWEVHEEADEVVACLSGGIRLHLRPREAAEAESVELPAGTAVVVPRGRWHRIELTAPSDILSVTLPHGSRLEPRI
ncbi:cupin [Streptomyces sp. NPDC048057]|uniref:cupin n=1 Tax=Streptomyces sp. NPDC048057 TaxID=3155628 RepID=UPI0033F14044